LLVLLPKQLSSRNVLSPSKIASYRQQNANPAAGKTSISALCVLKNEKTICKDCLFVLPERSVIFTPNTSQQKSERQKENGLICKIKRDEKLIPTGRFYSVLGAKRFCRNKPRRFSPGFVFQPAATSSRHGRREECGSAHLAA
jgi:hypothetical protein